MSHLPDLDIAKPGTAHRPALYVTSERIGFSELLAVDHMKTLGGSRSRAVDALSTRPRANLQKELVPEPNRPATSSEERRPARLGRGEDTVKKLLLTVLIACALLVAASMVAEATSPTEVSGEGDYTFQVSSTREAGPNLFMHATENEQWRGDMTGTGNSEFTVGMFAAGFWTVELRCEFQGAIGGKQGTLQLLMVGKKPLGSDWHGKW